MWLEIETKAKLKDSEVKNLRNEIKKIANLEKTLVKKDEYFSIQKNQKSYPTKTFRIRTTKKGFEINFKRWLKKYWTKDIVVKQEFEFSIKRKEELGSLLELFKDLGFKKWIQKIKYNETYQHKKDKRISIEINKVKDLGFFLEIEYLAKPSEIKKAKQKIMQVLNELKINQEQIDNTGYTKMLWREKFNKS